MVAAPAAGQGARTGTRRRPTAQPFQRPADVEIDVQRRHIDRDDANAVVAVEQDLRPDRVRLLDDGGGGQDVGALEQHVRQADQPRPLVNRVEQFLRVERDAVVGAYSDDLHLRQHRFDGVHVRREIHVADDNFAALRVAEIQRRKQNAVGDAGVLVDKDASGRRAHQRRDFVADAALQSHHASLPNAGVPHARTPSVAHVSAYSRSLSYTPRGIAPSELLIR